MAPPPGTDEAHTRENFAKFFKCWIAEQERDLQNLRSAFTSIALIKSRPRALRILLPRQALSARADVASMFSPSWISSTENLFLWVGGWRPTLFFHLLYSKSGLQLESHLDDILGGGGRMGQLGDLAVVTHYQLLRVDRLHQRTVRREREISEEAARAQETVADAEMVGLSSTVAAEGEEGVRNEAEMEAYRRDAASGTGRAIHDFCCGAASQSARVREEQGRRRRPYRRRRLVAELNPAMLFPPFSRQIDRTIEVSELYIS
ncbi:hypothetical protein ZIOFF_058898 [Zingiber officinale]|uniref:DOG1 domain-containing protein n=1 Tax=Zingiber officinale TaxID=94328 RepID=A0A8J5KJR2_ZINOF|nr:hypothetical protein ZIOFF_058898 [Zingiber officinale]